MKKEGLALKVAKLTIIVGNLTNWQSKITNYAQCESEISLFYILMNDFTLQELFFRLDELINELDCVEMDVVKECV